MNTTTWMTTTTQPQPWLLPRTDLPVHDTLALIKSLSKRYDSISLAQMDEVSLLDRIDTKYVMTTDQLFTALANVRPDYCMLEVGGKRQIHYRTLYFDTAGFDLFLAHVNNRPERYKVRSREYTDSQLSFLEVKHRTRKDRTIKKRICTSCPVVQVTSEFEDWLQGVSPLDGSELEPKLWNTFTRMTLVNKQRSERVTLDIDLSFSAGDRYARLDGIAIAEVKVDAAGSESRFQAQMRRQRIRACGFSKYAIGTGMLYNQVKKNSLKPKLLWIEKIMKTSGLAYGSSDLYRQTY